MRLISEPKNCNKRKKKVKNKGQVTVLQKASWPFKGLPRTVKSHPVQHEKNKKIKYKPIDN